MSDVHPIKWIRSALLLDIGAQSRRRSSCTHLAIILDGSVFLTDEKICVAVSIYIKGHWMSLFLIRLSQRVVIIRLLNESRGLSCTIIQEVHDLPVFVAHETVVIPVAVIVEAPWHGVRSWLSWTESDAEAVGGIGPLKEARQSGHILVG